MKRIRGFPDYLGEKAWKFYYLCNYLVNYAKKFGANLVLLPVVESKELFIKSLGDNTDIVHKEMFILEDDLVLRPEMTSSLVRCLKDEGLFKGRYSYFGPCFRRERPQKGRYRQFMQFGLEFIGFNQETEEMDLLLFIKNVIDYLKLPNIIIKMNSIGTSENRKLFSQDLKEFLMNNYENLSTDAKKKVDNNAYFRVLDSKFDEELLKNAPKITDYVDCSRLYKLLEFTKLIGLNAVIDHRIVRGLDYYNDFVFEIVPINNNLAQASLGGGGRYDGLFSYLGFQPTPALGFAFGIERLIEYMDDCEINIFKYSNIKIGICNNEKLLLQMNLWRMQNNNCEFMLLDNKHKNALNQANKQTLDFAIFPHMDLNNIYIIKCMKSGTQKYIIYENLHKLEFHIPAENLLLHNEHLFIDKNYNINL